VLGLLRLLLLLLRLPLRLLLQLLLLWKRLRWVLLTARLLPGVLLEALGAWIGCCSTRVAGTRGRVQLCDRRWCVHLR
jgi:hypothetical protein